VLERHFLTFPVGRFSASRSYLDAGVRQNMSNFALAEDDDVGPGLAALKADLASGAWDRAYGHLRTRPELDLGHRIFLATLS